MDKETLSNYGWIVICVLVLAVMIALATPFGNFIADAINSTKDGLFQTNQNALDIVLDDMGVLPAPDKLQEKYEFTYYSTFNDAIEAINDGVIAIESGVNKEDATAGVYVDENNVPNVVLLKDTTEMYLWPAADMVINLGGHVFTSTDNMAMYCPSGNIYIDGKLSGSGISVTTSDGVPAQGIMVDAACNLTIDGGTYTNIATNSTSAGVMVRGTVTAKNATFICKTTTGRMDGFCTYAGSTTNIINCDVLASGGNAHAYGVFMGDNCSVAITDSDIKGFANYNTNGSSYTASSLGVYQSANSTLTLNNCHVRGTLAGIQTYGTLDINGGVYEGYGHGGFYFVGRSTTSYIRNATIRECAMPEGYTNNDGTNHAGLYIGTGSSNSIYMDNCTIESNGSAVVLRGSSGDSLYMSNSRIGEDRTIRIDSTSQKLFIGKGCNFTADDTTLPSAVIQTSETYN